MLERIVQQSGQWSWGGAGLSGKQAGLSHLLLTRYPGLTWGVCLGSSHRILSPNSPWGCAQWFHNCFSCYWSTKGPVTGLYPITSWQPLQLRT